MCCTLEPKLLSFYYLLEYSALLHFLFSYIFTIFLGMVIYLFILYCSFHGDLKCITTLCFDCVMNVEYLLILSLSGAADYPSFCGLLKQLVGPLTTQLSDRRSSIVKQVH